MKKSIFYFYRIDFDILRASVPASRLLEGERPCEPFVGGRASPRAVCWRASVPASRLLEGERPREPFVGGRASPRAV
jgi:hypothetical protein